MVHASLRKVGPVEGRADGLIDALVETLGSDGTVVMVLGADADEPFEATETPADVEEMGVLAEVFRTRPETRVGDHAASRYAALGPVAAPLVEGTPLHDYHGPGSVLDRIVEREGQVLRLGADVDSVTLTHFAEYLADVPDKRRVRRRYVRADTGEQWIESLDDNDGIRDWDEGDYFSQILIDFVGRDLAQVGPVGQCQAELIEAKKFVEFATEWMEENLAT